MTLDEGYNIVELNPTYVEMFYKLFDYYNSLLPIDLRQILENLNDVEDYDFEELANVYKYSNVSSTQMKEYVYLFKIFQKLSDIKSNIEVITELLEDGLEEDVGELISDNNSAVHYIEDEISSISIEMPKEDREPEFNLGSQTMVLFSNGIEDARIRTMSAKSGKEMLTMKSINALINKLIFTGYSNLRKNNEIHHIFDSSGSMNINGSFIERLGIQTTKLLFLRIPISENNKIHLTTKYGYNKLDQAVLVLDFWDFHNEGKSEVQLYKETKMRLKKNYTQIAEIISLFKNDFTPETEVEVDNLIRCSFCITESLNENPKIPLDMDIQNNKKMSV